MNTAVALYKGVCWECEEECENCGKPPSGEKGFGAYATVLYLQPVLNPESYDGEAYATDDRGVPGRERFQMDLIVVDSREHWISWKCLLSSTCETTRVEIGISGVLLSSTGGIHSSGASYLCGFWGATLLERWFYFSYFHYLDIADFWS